MAGHVMKDRDLLMKVARGEIREDTHPWVFQDDLLYFALHWLSRADRAWLESFASSAPANLQGEIATILRKPG